MNRFVLRQSLLLLLCATIWGVAFVAQSVGMDYVGPFTFITARYIVGGLFLIPCIYLLDKMNKKTVKESSHNDKKTSFLFQKLCSAYVPLPQPRSCATLYNLPPNAQDAH